jgi:phage gp46-like protein
MNYNEGDVLIELKEDGFDLNIDSGLIELTGGFETAVLLSLFGGNDNNIEFWGNKFETEVLQKLNSQTQLILTGLPANPNNLKKLDEAIKVDLDWFKQDKIVDEIEIFTQIIAKNKVRITINMKKDNSIIFNTVYEKNWLSQSIK